MILVSIKTIIDANHKPNYSVVEFAREIPTNNYYRDVYVNDRVAKCQCHIYIYHHNSYYVNETKWRQYTSNYSLIDYSIVFPNNIKNLFYKINQKMCGLSAHLLIRFIWFVVLRK